MKTTHLIPVGLVLLALSSLPGAQRARPMDVRPDDVSVQGFQARPYCPPAMDDLAGGGCMPASSTPTMGALYPLSLDFNLDPATGFVGLGTTAPTERLHLNGNLAFKAVDQGIVFTSNNPFFAPAAPMLTMFTSGSSNPDRMVLGHSPSFPNYGLAYQDDEDRFVFQRTPTGPAVTIDLNQPALWTSDVSGTQTTLLSSASPNGGVVLARDSFGLIRAALGGANGEVLAYHANGNLGAVLDGDAGQLHLKDGSETTTAFLSYGSNGLFELGASPGSGEGGIRMSGGGTTDPHLIMYEMDGSRLFQADSSGLALFDSNGAATVNFDRQTGAKNAVVTTESHGQRTLYNEESTEVWFTDYGSGRLEEGQARVELDPVFLETVVVDEDHPIKVFVTLTAASMPVWVEKGADHFVVHEQLDGRSDASFDYRVVAKRRGLEDARLEPFEAD